MIYLVAVVLICFVLLFVNDSLIMTSILLIAGVVCLGFVFHELEEEENSFLYNLEEQANRTLQTEDAVATHKENGKYEVIAGNAIYTAYVNKKDHTKVKFLKVAEFEE